MTNYQQLIKNILETGVIRDDRTGTGTLSKFGHHLVFNLKDGFPLITTRMLSFNTVVCELLWSLKGFTNISYLPLYMTILGYCKFVIFFFIFCKASASILENI